mmetsp:Transcript_150679/g.280964  ORF Transcript_150679/g.280964 Transcript_150679/m.280964 type:complete len:389 (-) Transcript_150679:71-1237(-)
MVMCILFVLLFLPASISCSESASIASCDQAPDIDLDIEASPLETAESVGRLQLSFLQHELRLTKTLTAGGGGQLANFSNRGSKLNASVNASHLLIHASSHVKHVGKGGFENYIHAQSHSLDDMEGEISLIGKASHKLRLQLSGGIITIAVILGCCFCCCCTGLANWIIKNLLGDAVEFFIESLDKTVLGVEVTVGDINLSPLTGRLRISNMTVCNPTAKPPYSTPYLLHADRVVLDINLQVLISSFTSAIDIEQFVLSGVRLHYDKPYLLTGKSNIEVVKEFACDSQTKSNQTTRATEEKASEDTGQEEESQRSFTINRLKIEDIEADATIKGKVIPFKLPTIESKDFSKECKGTGISDVIVALVEKLAEGIMTGAVKEIEKDLMGGS